KLEKGGGLRSIGSVLVFSGEPTTPICPRKPRPAKKPASAASLLLHFWRKAFYGAAEIRRSFQTMQLEHDMAAHGIPHFQNDGGHAVIEIGVKEFMCTGASVPFDHPHIYIDMGDDNEKVCSYCSTLYRFNDKLHAD